MAHLAHKLPWQTLSAPLVLVHEKKGITPSYTDLFIKSGNEEAASKALDTFLSAFSQVITDFAESERKKYPLHYPAKDCVELYDNSIWDAEVKPYFEDLNLERYGLWHTNLYEAKFMESWEKNVGNPPEPSLDNAYNGVVATLLAEHRVDALLKLAQNPGVRLDLLHDTGFNQHASFAQLIFNTLQAYLCFNVLYLRPELWSGGSKTHFQLRSFSRVMCNQRSIELGKVVYYFARKKMGWSEREAWEPKEESKQYDPFADLVKLQQYLKACFQLLVDFEVLGREMNGQSINWRFAFAEAIGEHGPLRARSGLSFGLAYPTEGKLFG